MTSEIQRIAGDVVNGDTKPGIFMLFPVNYDNSCKQELQIISNYVCNTEWTIEQFNEVAFMFACFTLLMEGDDNF